MFTKTAQYYDRLYQFKNYLAESNTLRGFIAQHKQPNAPNTLLDVACGTGGHMIHLCGDFTCEGLDLDADLLAIAREKLPNSLFHHADMIDFALDKQFGVVICMFSAIGYVQTVSALEKAIAAMRRHVAPGGVLLVEPSFFVETFKPRFVGMLTVDDPELKIARVNRSTIEQGAENPIAVLNFHYVIGTPDGVEFAQETHRLGLFPHDAYAHAFEKAGMRVQFDSYGVDGRGLYIGT